MRSFIAPRGEKPSRPLLAPLLRYRHDGGSARETRSFWGSRSPRRRRQTQADLLCFGLGEVSTCRAGDRVMGSVATLIGAGDLANDDPRRGSQADSSKSFSMN